MTFNEIATWSSLYNDCCTTNVQYCSTIYDTHDIQYLTKMTSKNELIVNLREYGDILFFVDIDVDFMSDIAECKLQIPSQCGTMDKTNNQYLLWEMPLQLTMQHDLNSSCWRVSMGDGGFPMIFLMRASACPSANLCFLNAKGIRSITLHHASIEHWELRRNLFCHVPELMLPSGHILRKQH
jgi:hypothetical protein